MLSTLAPMPAVNAAPLTLEQLKKLADRYAPITRFHPQEQYFMCTIDWYLLRGTLCGLNGFSKKSPTVNDLPTGNTDDGNYWLEMTEAAKKGDLSTARTYVHAFWQPGKTYIDLQYWFCYGYNGPGTLYAHNPLNHQDVNLAPLGEHWIDWEQMTLRIKIETQQVLGVYLSQHGEGQWITDLKQFERKNDQFIVYASKNGHALYPKPGDNFTHSYDIAGVIGFSLRNDTFAGGQSFDSSGRLDIVSAGFLPEVVEPKWLHFPYRFGLGSESHITKDTINSTLKGLLGPIGWIISIVGAPVINGLADAILPVIKLDDTNGVYGPQTQSYWKSELIPKFNINIGYTGNNTNSGTPPDITSFNGQYHIFFQDHNGKGIMQITSIDGISWSGNDKYFFGHTTSAGPCSIVFQGKLYLFYRDGAGNGILYTTSADGINWSPAIYIGLNCDGQPSAAVIGNKLCVVAIDHNGSGIMWAVQTGGVGAWSHGYSNFTTNAGTPPCIVVFNNQFHVFFQDHSGQGIMHITSPDGVKWSQSPVFFTGYTTSAGPAAIQFEELLYVLFRDGTGNGILYIQSEDGIGFKPAPSWYIGLNCDHEPRITADPETKEMCLVCVDQGGNGIMRAVFKPW